ncbi:hypothetical protein HHL11_03500 [Ramlibacter sp. G-1-2-2]|uniref:Carboxypeptidase regulatory-like domain-containing protein n=1 Tax=Ramlibacter agri TaxID=2728837 RepID=A0A848H254_9BURK|nr:hypothetical protein [Ramlibacter agri]NML42803.1 hypothetical protein [Ramlibacter agri]
MLFHRFARRAAAISLPVLLAACGGGSSDSTLSTPVTPTTPAAALSVSGTAATGAPLANAAITLKCASGSATATADANGKYTASITGGKLPCVLTAKSTDGATELHSVAAGTGDAATTVNITPLTELLLARLTGGDPKAYVAGFSATVTISAADVAAAQAALLQTLQAAGVDTTNVADILAGALTAGSHTGYDGVLDQLQVTITAAGSSLAELVTAVSSTSATGTQTSAATVGTVLAPASSDCAALKTGGLRYVHLVDGQSGSLQVDAKAMSATLGGSSYTLTRNASCDYALNDAAGTRLLFSRGGVAMMLQGSGASAVAALAVPDQALDLAALAGTYDRLQYGPTFDDQAGEFGTTVFAADGQNGVSVNCPLGYGQCTQDTQDKGKLVANANGGFDYMEQGVSQGRIFAFRNAAGRNFMLVVSPEDGGVVVLAQQADLALPTVGSSTSFWQVSVNGSTVGAVTADTNTVTAVDAAAKTATRKFTSDSHSDTLAFNTPFSGMRYRATNGCTSSTGGAFSCNGVVQLPLGGLVISVSSVPTKHFVNVSLNQP